MLARPVEESHVNVSAVVSHGEGVRRERYPHNLLAVHVAHVDVRVARQRGRICDGDAHVVGGATYDDLRRRRPPRRRLDKGNGDPYGGLRDVDV